MKSSYFTPRRSELGLVGGLLERGWRFWNFPPVPHLREKCLTAVDLAFDQGSEKHAQFAVNAVQVTRMFKAAGRITLQCKCTALLVEMICSNELKIELQHVEECLQLYKRLYGASDEESVRVSCRAATTQSITSYFSNRYLSCVPIVAILSPDVEGQMKAPTGEEDVGDLTLSCQLHNETKTPFLEFIDRLDVALKTTFSIASTSFLMPHLRCGATYGSTTGSAGGVEQGYRRGKRKLHRERLKVERKSPFTDSGNISDERPRRTHRHGRSSTDRLPRRLPSPTPKTSPPQSLKTCRQSLVCNTHIIPRFNLPLAFEYSTRTPYVLTRASVLPLHTSEAVFALCLPPFSPSSPHAATLSAQAFFLALLSIYHAHHLSFVKIIYTNISDDRKVGTMAKAKADGRKGRGRPPKSAKKTDEDGAPVAPVKKVEKNPTDKKKRGRPPGAGKAKAEPKAKTTSSRRAKKDDNDSDNGEADAPATSSIEDEENSE
ncbi:unnamed protein product [Caenorhabditis auriculariae]|uniref:Uncharacterized protein n=1 Tax=Caenorhabditis auriculariae TaxID=2777116 RepID=A0A8S1GPF1_9PELO|nr:unnamed protein product [Caenorhabditis auriculariae]